jgi:hypothetical protein
MNRRTDKERLFADALADAGPAGFRESMLGETLRLARRRRQFRQLRHGGIALGIVVLLAICFRPRTVSQRANAGNTPLSYTLVETQPLSANAIVATRPFTGDIVVSAPTVSVITTAQAGDGLRELTDDELLALAPTPAALIRLGPHSAELVLANQNKSDSP